MMRPLITVWSVLRHMGPFGLFVFAIFDNSPLPTLNGPDFLIVILAARRVQPWFYYAIAGTVGSIIGAYITFRIARTAGSSYLEKNSASAVSKQS